MGVPPADPPRRRHREAPVPRFGCAEIELLRRRAWGAGLAPGRDPDGPTAISSASASSTSGTPNATVAVGGQVPRRAAPHYTRRIWLHSTPLYEDEQVRGATRGRGDEVAVGEPLGPIAKGPLTLTDMVTWHTGIGWGVSRRRASKVAYKNRKRVPKLYTANSLGIPDTSQRCHWDTECAVELGHPAPYDYGQMRGNWMVHLLTNWMGDGGWIWTMSTVITKFNYLGDSHRISGRVRRGAPRRRSWRGRR